MFKDIFETFSKANQFLVFGFQDIKVRYRRSPIGAFWITINMAISITVLSFVFGVLFNTLIKDLILKTCTRVIWLENGLVKEDGKSNEIIEKYFI